MCTGALFSFRVTNSWAENDDPYYSPEIFCDCLGMLRQKWPSIEGIFTIQCNDDDPTKA
ncbi:hypothetical protein SLEP1_g56590 [Rubroshorea leprosula]|uniref:Uncharacterized protein n=1 Tax=Rubroshorea leprosula TaxID=152421 RepID=A0AAV5MK48_9ROSI|nr:hypothetical protein SLEP1_g56590 [Rubroshorea leprosula]